MSLNYTPKIKYKNVANVLKLHILSDKAFKKYQATTQARQSLSKNLNSIFNSILSSFIK
jgi:hypothetical protein